MLNEPFSLLKSHEKMSDKGDIRQVNLGTPLNIPRIILILSQLVIDLAQALAIYSRSTVAHTHEPGLYG